MSKWPSIWNTLRRNLLNLSPCPQHPKYPHVRTLTQGVINDIISVEGNGIRVRSHRTCYVDYIEEKRFKVWWDHLITHGSASLSPGNKNNPHPWRSRIVGAIFVECLPDKIRVDISHTIELQ